MKGLQDLQFEDENLNMLHQHVIQHIDECNARDDYWRVQFDRVVKSQEATTLATKELARQTKDVVELHRDIQGAARIGIKVQDFMIWMAKWGVIGSAIIAGITFVAEQMDKGG